jgi:hypothetical protein
MSDISQCNRHVRFTRESRHQRLCTSSAPGHSICACKLCVGCKQANGSTFSQHRYRHKSGAVAKSLEFAP